MRTPIGVSKHKPTLLTLFFIVFIDLVGFGLVLPMIQFIAKTYGATGVGVGIIFAAFSLMQFLLAPFWGSLSDRFGRRPILLLSLGGSVLSYALFAFAQSYETVLLSRLAAGICGANIGVASAYIADITEAKDRTKGMGVIGAAFGLGFILGPVIGIVLFHLGEFKAVGLGAAAICLANLILAFFVLPESLPVEKRRAGGFMVWGNLWNGWDTALRSPTIVNILLISFLINLTFTIWETTSGLFLFNNPAFFYRETEYAWLLVFIGLIAALVQGGGMKRLSRKFGEKKLLMTGTVFLTIFMGFFPSAWNLTTLLILSLLYGLGMAFSRPVMSSLVSNETSAQEQGAVMGVAQSVASLTRIIGPILGGWFFDRQRELPYWVACGFLLIALVLEQRVKKESPSQEAAAS